MTGAENWWERDPVAPADEGQWWASDPLYKPDFGSVRGGSKSSETAVAAGTDIPLDPGERIVGNVYRDRQGNPRRWGDGAWLTADESRETTAGEWLQGQGVRAAQGLARIPQTAINTANLPLRLMGSGLSQDALNSVDAATRDAVGYYDQFKPAAFRGEELVTPIARTTDGDFAGMRMPSSEAAIGTFTESAPQMPMFLAGGGWAKQGAETVLKNSPRLATALGYGAANAALIAPQQRQDTYSEAIAAGMSEEEAQAAATKAEAMTAGLTFGTGAAGAALSEVGGAAAGSMRGAMLRGFAAEAPFEGVEEGGQSLVGDYAIGRKLDYVRAGDQAALAGIVGGVPGSAIAGMEYARRGDAPPTPDLSQTLIEAGNHVLGDVPAPARRGADTANEMLRSAGIGVVPEAAAPQSPGTVTRVPGGGYRVASASGEMQFDGPDARAQAAEFAMQARAEATNAPTPELPEPHPSPAVEPPPELRAAPVALAGPEAGTIIDQRLQALDEAANGALPREQLATLRREDAELAARLRKSEEVAASGVLPADPRARLRPEEVDAISQRRVAIRSDMERSRTAVGAADQAKRLRERLGKIDRDADLLALAEEIRGPVAPAQALAATGAPVPQAQAQQAPSDSDATAPQAAPVDTPAPSPVAPAGNAIRTESATPPASSEPGQAPAAQMQAETVEVERVEAELAKKRQVRKSVDSVVEQSPQQTVIEERGKARDKAAVAVGVNAKYVTDAKRIEREAPADESPLLEAAPVPNQAPQALPEAFDEQAVAPPAMPVTEIDAATSAATPVETATPDAAISARVERSLSELDGGSLLINQRDDYRIAKMRDDEYLIGSFSARGGQRRRVDRAGVETYLREQYARDAVPGPASGDAPAEVDAPTPQAAQAPADKPAPVMGVASREDQSSPAPPPAADTEAKRTTGTKNTITDAEREAAGRNPILRDALKSNEETLAEALRTLRDNPDAGDEAVRRIGRDGAASVSLADEALLLAHKTELLNRRDEATRKLADPDATDEAKNVARERWSEAEARIAELDQATVNAGREWGRMGQFRQRMLREDFTFEALERKERARLERPLTAAESENIKAMADRIAEMQSKVDTLQARLANAESEGALDEVVQSLRRAPRSRPTLEALRSAAEEARARLAAMPDVPSRRRQSGAVISPAALRDVAVIGAYHLANGASKFSDWVVAMRADIGAAFDSYKAEHPRIFKAAQGQVGRPLKASSTVADVMAEIDLAHVTAKDVRKLIEALLREGVRGESAVIEAAADKLGIEQTEVRRLFVETVPRAKPTLSEMQAELRDLRRLVRLQNEIERIEAGLPKPGKAAPLEDSPAVAEKKERLAELRKSVRAISDPEGRYQGMRATQIKRRMQELQERIKAGDFAARPRVPRALSEANQRALFELEKVKEEFLRHQFLDSMRARSRFGKALGYVGDTLNLSRVVMTSLDFSGVLRQGGFVAFAHPIRAATSIGPMLRAFVSERAEFAVMREIESRGNAHLYRRYGLELTGTGQGTLSKIEEGYASRWIEKASMVEGQPVRNLARRLKNVALGPVRGSGRSYVTFLNKLRADSFDAMAATLSSKGTPSEAEGKAIAGFINAATGRGKIWGGTNPGAVLNTLFFAPRLVTSRFQLATGLPIWTAPTPRMKKAIAVEYARVLTGVAAVMSLLAFALDDDGDEQDFWDHFTFDPRSSDFMKLRFGDTVLDPFMGLSQVAVFLSRIATGETVTRDGETRALRPQWTLTDLRRAFGSDVPAHEVDDDGSLPYGARDSMDTIMSFVRSKLAPPTGAAVNLASGSDFLGRPITVGQQALDMAMPMSFGDIAEAMEDRGVPRGTAVGLLGLLGMSIQVHNAAPEKELAKARGDLDEARADMKERLSELPVEEWPRALEEMKRAHGPATDDVVLLYYKRDSENGRAGEPQRDKDGVPKLALARISDPERYRANYADQLAARGTSGDDIARDMDKNQIHHIIPDNIVRRHRLMIHAREAGYNLDSAGNLIGLTGTDTEATRSGAEVGHRTSHPDYDAVVFGELNAVEKRLRREYGALKDVPADKMLEAVREVEEAMRARILRREVPIKDGRLSGLPDRETEAAA